MYSIHGVMQCYDDDVGTQRLIRAIGKSKAMELILTGSTMGAVQAEQCGLVSKVVSVEQLLPTAMELASKIASFSQPAIAMAKETVSAAHELSLQEGLRFERRIFHSMFALDDQKVSLSVA
jgi:enoyl-CoA hydratase/carnithine racemase